MSERVITANRLDDGTVVYLSGDDGWSPHIADARVASDEDEAVVMMAAGENAENQGIVVGAYLIPVVRTGGDIQAERLREDIRAGGPTRRTDAAPAA